MTIHARPRLGFYCPGNGTGGPWRYVHSLLQGVDPEEFAVTLLCDLPGEYPGRPDIEVVPLSPASGPAAGVGQESVSHEPRAANRWRRVRRFGRLLPAAARMYVGFQRQTARLAKLLRAHPVDLLHTQNTGCEESPIAARKAGVPTVLGTFHVDSTYDLEGIRSGAAHRYLEWASNRCLHRAIAVSEATKRDWVRRTGIPAERVVVIHNGIDAKRFERRQSREAARAALGLPREALVLGGLGRLDPAKGFSYLIEALAHLRADFPQAMVAIAGTGQLQQSLRDQARSLGVADRVALLGFQSDVNVLLDACDVFIMPSLCETLGYALLEAMAHELPAVGTRIGGIPEVIADGETGFLCPDRDGVALAAAIRPLLRSAELRQRLGCAGRQRVIARFQEAEMVQRTLDVYRQSAMPATLLKTA